MDAIGPQAYGWLDNPAWGQTFLPVLVVLLAVRLATIGFLTGSQHGHRSRTVTRLRRRQVRAVYARDASQRQHVLRQLRVHYPARWLASVVDPLVALVVLGGFAAALYAVPFHHFTDPADVAELELFRNSPPWPFSRPLSVVFGTDPGGAVAALTGLGLAVCWVALWAGTRFLVLCSRMPSGTWERSSTRRFLVLHLAARLLLALAAASLPVLAVLILWQLFSLWRARALHHSPVVYTPPGVGGLPLVGEVRTGAVTGAVAALGTVVARAGAAREARALRRAAEAETARIRAERDARAQEAAAAAQAELDARDAEAAARVMAESQALRESREQRSTEETVQVPRPRPEGDASPPAGTGTAVPCTPLRAGAPRSIGAYRLLGEIGTGGFGTVYLAQRQGSMTQVALKTLHADLLHEPELLRRFRNEAEVLAQVPEAFTAKVLGTGLADGVPYIAMELLDGLPLDRYLREHGTMRSGETLRALAFALAVALDAMHGRRLVHRDLKPSNVMMTSDGPRLLDFGIAMMVDRTRITRTGPGPGTPAFMSPEQIQDGLVGPPADIWAWGCCIAAAAHGTSPFNAGSVHAIYPKIVGSPPDPHAMAAVRALDPALADVVELALTKPVATRPADGDALLRLLLPDAPRAADGGRSAIGPGGPGVPGGPGGPDVGRSAGEVPGALAAEITRVWQQLKL